MIRIVSLCTALTVLALAACAPQAQTSTPASDTMTDPMTDTMTDDMTDTEMMAEMEMDAMTITTTMSGSEVVPPVMTSASATATATLMGSTLMVEGSFMGLDGMLRDYTVDPVDDPDLNARLTSAVHVHMGEMGENGPLQFVLEVDSADGMNGTFMGSFELDDAQLEALASGMMYYDIHTSANRAGELRGQIVMEMASAAK